MKAYNIRCALISLAVASAQMLQARQDPVPGRGAEPGTSVTDYEYKETRQLVQLVNDAAELLRSKGEAALADFRVPGSRWRQDETYIFVVDLQRNMLVHPDPTMEGTKGLDAKDVNGRAITRGLVAAATLPGKPGGWYHYQWPVPGGLMARWKSTYVRLVTLPSGERLVVCSGMYNDRMEKSFVVDIVKNAVSSIEQSGEAAFPLFYDPTGPFLVKDAYVFVVDPSGIELVNGGFADFKGRNVLHLKDTQGKELIRDMFKLVQSAGSGWVDYMWPKPGESVPTQKSTFVAKARLGDKSLLVGCGVYLADAPKAPALVKKMTAPEVMALVRDGAAVLEKQGEKAFPEFRQKNTKWFSDETYFFIWTMDQKAVFHAADPSLEGTERSGAKDVLGRPYSTMFMEAVANPKGEGWVHYMYPEPQSIFPSWKSTFIKRVTFPSGKEHILGCGVYNMEMNETFIEDVVNGAAALLQTEGTNAFGKLRDKTGPYLFLDTYVFVYGTDGLEVVNPGQPSLEGKNLLDVRDVNGKLCIKDSIAAALEKGSAWVDYYWYKPGHNTPARKHAFVRKVEFGGATYIVGSGYYPPEQEIKVSQIQKTSWNSVKREDLSDSLSRQTISGEKATLAQLSAKRGGRVARHSHVSEEYSWVTSGTLKFIFDDREVEVGAGEVIVIPANVSHSLLALEDATLVDFFAPPRLDWMRGEDLYLRQ